MGVRLDRAVVQAGCGTVCLNDTAANQHAASAATIIAAQFVANPSFDDRCNCQLTEWATFDGLAPAIAAGALPAIVCFKLQVVWTLFVGTALRLS